MQAAGQGGDDEQQQQKREQEEQMRRDLLTTVLDSAARERCAFSIPSPRASVLCPSRPSARSCL